MAMLSTLYGVMLDGELPTPLSAVLAPSCTKTNAKHQLSLTKALHITIKFDYLMGSGAQQH